MTSRAWCALLVAAACGGGPAPAPRARLLAQLPADATLVVVADGRALAAPRVRAVVDALRPRWPARLGCAIDAALGAEHAGFGLTADGAGTLALVTRAPVACAALSEVAPGLWVASLGAGRPGGAPVSHLPRFARARPYLEGAALVVALDLPLGRIVASARIEPLEGWLVVETRPELAEAAARQLADVRARLAQDPVTAPLAGRVTITRAGAQVTARLPPGPDADLPAIARALATALTRPPAKAPPAACPPPPYAPPLIDCRAGKVLVVTSLAAAYAPIVTASAPVFVREQVVGLRLTAPAPALGLVAGDLVTALDGHALTDVAQVTAGLAAAVARDGITSVVVQRGGAPVTLSVAEAPR